MATATAFKDSAEDDLSFVDLRASIVLFSVCPYLAPSDLLALRATCRRSLNWLHEEQESEQMWTLRLERDFGLDRNWKQVIRVLNRNNTSTSLFGAEPGSDEFWIQTETPFEAWKAWLRVSSRFYKARAQRHVYDGNDRIGPIGYDPLFVQQAHAETSSVLHPEPTQWTVHAPYFMRAAQFWESIHQWCKDEVHRGFGEQLLRSLANDNENFSTAGLCYVDWDETCRTLPGMQAAMAVFAFGCGQNPSLMRGRLGLMGGYDAYGYVSSVALRLTTSTAVQIDVALRRLMFQNSTEEEQQTPRIMVAWDHFALRSGLEKNFYLNAVTGGLDCMVNREFVQPAISRTQENVNALPQQKDDFLVWLENHAQRLKTGILRVERVGTPLFALTQYPHFPRNTPPIVTDKTIPSVVSRAVTRGVECVASAVYVPQARQQMGFIYSIRLRLLTPGEEGYLAPNERGFHTCQLVSRSWRITNDTTGETNHVDGEGVIGMFPLLFEGGFEESGERGAGTFQYQSCTGPMARGSFAGHLRFVPQSRSEPGGEHFDVQLHPFALSNRPDFLY